MTRTSQGSLAKILRHFCFFNFFLSLVVFLGSEKQFLVKEKINLNYYTVDFIFGGKCLKGKIEREVRKRGRGG